MPKGTEAPTFSSVATDGYVWGNQGGVFGRWPVSLVGGSGVDTGTGGGGATTFVGLSDVPAEYTGSAHKSVMVNAGETGLEFSNVVTISDTEPATPYSGQLWLDTKTTQAYSVVAGTVSDITAATSDVFLPVGAIVYLTYSSATSIPVNVQTEEGIYEVEVYNTLNSSAIDGTAKWLPNNTSTGTSFSNVLHYYDYQTSDSSGSALWDGWKSMGSAEFKLWMSSGNMSLKMSTFKDAKTLTERGVARRVINNTTSVRPLTSYGFWNDTTTDWTSLGTLECSTALTGKIIIRRII